jgi:16S rRNA (guanine(966)-N(2))-methyltransferase RsmD
MRITGGKYRGRIVDVPAGKMEIRPAMDRMRESIFAVLGDLNGFSFLDLFAGSGILGLEAASRGAFPIVCVERDRSKFPVLLKNVALAEEHIECKAIPVERFLLRNKTSFDIVFCDPPFPYAFREQILRYLASGPSLAEGGLVLMHFPREQNLPLHLLTLEKVDERDFGRSIVRFYRKNPTSKSIPLSTVSDEV